ncbi:MAG: 30S ribosomal protein S17 [Kiritimatiellia bacterium]|nr:30S ribosomal protein S17 [Lentisphaerota bacterium]
MPEDVKGRGKRKLRVGFVVSNAMDKTIVVRVERRVRHPLYGKEMRLSSKLHAHDEKNDARLGDRVEVVETRPLSRMKRWRLTRVLGRAVSVEQQ